MRSTTICAAILVASLTAGSATALATPEITADLSPQAREYLKQSKSGDLPAMDMSDPERMAKLRKALGTMFLRSAQKIDPDLFLTEQQFKRHYWLLGKQRQTGADRKCNSLFAWWRAHTRLGPDQPGQRNSCT